MLGPCSGACGQLEIVIRYFDVSKREFNHHTEDTATALTLIANHATHGDLEMHQ